MVTVAYTGTVQTVTGTPLGFDVSVRLEPVTGCISYDVCLPDSNATSERGEYDHAPTFTSGFEFELEGVVVTGSGRAIVEIEDFASSDTFRYKDGPQFFDSTNRSLFVDGVPDFDLELWISITDGTSAAHPDDSIPSVFPMSDITSYTHTFSVSDDDGTLLMQLDAMGQTVFP